MTEQINQNDLVFMMILYDWRIIFVERIKLQSIKFRLSDYENDFFGSDKI